MARSGGQLVAHAPRLEMYMIWLYKCTVYMVQVCRPHPPPTKGYGVCMYLYVSMYVCMYSMPRPPLWVGGGVSVCTCMYGCMYVFVCKYVCVYV